MGSSAGLGGMIGASTQGTTGFLTILEGKIDKSKAKKAEKALGAKPIYNIPNPTFQNQTIAENRAQQGLSDATLQLYQQNADRGFSGSLDALMKSGAGINSVSQLYGAYADNISKLAALNDQAEMANQNLLMQQNSIMADELDKQWQLNVLDPWKDAKQRIAQEKALAESKVWGGRSLVAQSGSTIASTEFSGMGGGNKSGGKSGGGQFQPQQESANMSELNYQARGIDNKWENNGQPYYKRNFYLDNYA